MKSRAGQRFLGPLIFCAILAGAYFAYLHFSDPESFKIRLARRFNQEPAVLSVQPAWRNSPGMVLRPIEINWLKAREAFAGAGLTKRGLSLRHFVFYDPQIFVLRGPDGRWNFAGKIPQVPLYFRGQTGLHYEDQSKGAEPFRGDFVAGSLKIIPSRNGSPWLLRLASNLPPFDRLSAEAEYAPADDHAQIAVKSNQLQITAEAENLNANPRWVFKLESRFNGVPPLHGLQGGLVPDGKYRISLEGRGEGTHPQMALMGLHAEGAVDIREGHWRGRNLLQEVLRSITPLPGLEPLSELGAAEREAVFPLGEPDLPFEILQAEIRVRSGRLWIERLTLKHSHYLIQADGSVNLTERDMEFRMKVVLLEALSKRLIEKAPRIKRLENEEGRIIIPFVYRGLYPEPSVFPELIYLTEKMADPAP